jgi:hypothetical protein
MENRKPSAAAILIALLIPAALVTAYVAGYFWLSEEATALGMPARPRIVRVYSSRLLAEIFRPAARIENAVSSHDVIIAPQSGPLLPGE